MTKIKICGLKTLDDIKAANAAKPDFVGFVFAESPRQIMPLDAWDMKNALSEGIIPVGVFVNSPLEVITMILRSGAIEGVQLHGGEDEEFVLNVKLVMARLKAAGEIKNEGFVIKAVQVEKLGDAQEWENSGADYLLLDGKNAGSGKAFDWNLIGKLKKPFFLAGGLNSENVTDAVRKAAPFAVDTSSGVEISPGVKCPGKIMEFVGSCRAKHGANA